jgi:hypothetical protein
MAEDRIFLTDSKTLRKAILAMEEEHAEELGGLLEQLGP